MNRRYFFKSLFAVAVASQLPLEALSFKPLASSVVWDVQLFDYDREMGLCATVGGRRYAVKGEARFETRVEDEATYKEILLELLRDKGCIA